MRRKKDDADFLKKSLLNPYNPKFAKKTYQVYKTKR